MKYNKKIIKASFIKRPNRFNASVLIDGEEIVVHVPNTGRCREILIPGCTVYLREELNPNRKTRYDLIAALKGDKLISIDSQIPNKVVKEALQLGVVEKLKLSNDDGEEYYLEVKGVTLEEERRCRFPDAPTDRGRKHLLELIEVKKSGRGAGVLFLIQIEDVVSFTPNDETDPKFAEALRLANENGVDIFAYSCRVTEDSITLFKPLDIIL